MCKYGDHQKVMVRIPEDLSCSGKRYLKHAKIDQCIASIVRALQDGGIDMRSSCCGHGKWNGEIVLQDGRTLVIQRWK